MGVSQINVVVTSPGENDSVDVQLVEQSDTVHVTGLEERGEPGHSPSYAETLATGGLATHVVNHGLGTQDVIVQIYELISGNYEQVWATVRRPTLDSVTITFANPPAANAYRVVVHPAG